MHIFPNKKLNWIFKSLKNKKKDYILNNKQFTEPLYSKVIRVFIKSLKISSNSVKLIKIYKYNNSLYLYQILLLLLFF